jgi:hypothetical protein
MLLQPDALATWALQVPQDENHYAVARDFLLKEVIMQEEIAPRQHNDSRPSGDYAHDKPAAGRNCTARAPR